MANQTHSLNTHHVIRTYSSAPSPILDKVRCVISFVHSQQFNFVEQQQYDCFHEFSPCKFCCDVEFRKYYKKVLVISVVVKIYVKNILPCQTIDLGSKCQEGMLSDISMWICSVYFWNMRDEKCYAIGVFQQLRHVCFIGKMASKSVNLLYYQIKITLSFL